MGPKPRTEKGNATIPASTESKPHPRGGRELQERAQSWGKAKSRGPEAVICTMGKVVSSVVYSLVRFVSTLGKMLGQLTKSMVCKTCQSKW